MILSLLLGNITDSHNVIQQHEELKSLCSSTQNSMKAIKRFFFTLFAVLVSAYISEASPSDTLHTLVKFEEIKYNSPFEKKVFEDYFQKSKENYLDLFLAISKEADEESFDLNKKKFILKTQEIKSEIEGKRKENKQIQTIYKMAHEAFLRKYELNNEFNDIFKSGQFNCVSASALYSLIFEELNIPFTIKETPTHVYIISYPETHRILVETTDPLQGYYVFDSRYKTNYVDKLKQNKIISNEEFSNNTIDHLFDKYYFSDGDIDLKKLVGIQYLNNGIFLFDEGKEEEAFRQFEKAYLFYPSEKAIFLLYNTLLMILHNQDFSTLENVDYLARLSRFDDASMKNDIYAHFNKITLDYLVNSYKPAYYAEVYEYLMKAITSEEIRKEISYVYHFESARLLYNKGKYKESVVSMKEAFQLKPENSDAQSLMISAVSSSLNSISDNSERIKQLEILSEEYPVLLENSMFTNNLSQVYMIQFAQYFEIGNGKEGEKYKSLFEKNIKENDNSSLDENLIGRAYSLAAVYYFKKGNNARTKQILNEGLKLAPNNFELTQRLKLVR